MGVNDLDAHLAASGRPDNLQLHQRSLALGRVQHREQPHAAEEEPRRFGATERESGQDYWTPHGVLDDSEGILGGVFAALIPFSTPLGGFVSYWSFSDKYPRKAPRAIGMV